jgi:hypothetical protein
MPVIRAWCRKHDVAIPDPWHQGEPQAVVRYLENTGLLDFDAPGDHRLSGRLRGAGPRRERQTDAQRQAMGLAGEWLAYQFLRRRHPEYVDESCWISENRTRFFGGQDGDDSAGHDFLVKTPQADWLYEVKSSLEDSGDSN